MHNDIFIYKLTTDNGGAPCIKNDLLSLCICKPRIRKSAKKGDWIIGMGGKSVPDLEGRLIYIAEVTDVIENGGYYKTDRYSKRPDCIYQCKDGEYRCKENSSYHSEEDLSHDVGTAPDYNRAVCLISNKFVYFGHNPKPSIEGIQDIYNELPRDFIVNHDENTRVKLSEFICSIVEKFGYGKHGEPTHRDTSRKCNVEDGGLMQCSKKC